VIAVLRAANFVLAVASLGSKPVLFPLSKKKSHKKQEQKQQQQVPSASRLTIRHVFIIIMPIELKMFFLNMNRIEMLLYFAGGICFYVASSIFLEATSCQVGSI